MKIKHAIHMMKGKKRTLYAARFCQGIKGLGDNPEQILSKLHTSVKSPYGEK